MKIGCICEGGGLKCAYSAGILDQFIEDDISFDYCIGVSAGSANLSSYLAGQKGRNLRFYTQWIEDKGFYGKKALFKYGGLFGIEYIYGNLTNSNGKDPLDFNALMKNPTEFELVATDAQSGKAVYFDKGIMKQDDYRAIMASSAIPAACKPIQINHHAYFDGGISDAIPVERAIEKGCDRLVVILSKPRNFIKKPEDHKKIYSLLCARYPKIVEDLNQRHVMYSHQQRLLYQLEAQGKVFIFAPDEHVPMATASLNRKDNQQLYDLGVYDYIKYKQDLKDFLEKEE